MHSNQNNPAQLTVVDRDQEPAAGSEHAGGEGEALAFDLDVSIQRWITIGAVTIFSILGSMIAWGATAPLSSAVVAQGRVIVESNTKKIAHLEGGIVRRLKIKNGSRVKKGDILFSIDETRALASVLTTKSALNARLAREARLVAEVSKADKIAFPDELIRQSTDSAVAGIMKLETDIFKSRALAGDGEISILKRQRQQLALQIDGVKSQLDTTVQRHEILQNEIKSLSGLLKRGLVSQQRVLALQREERNLAGQIGGFEAERARIRKAIDENVLEAEQIKKKFEESVVNDLSTVRGEIIDYRQQLLAARDVLNRSQVRAPVDGSVVGLQVHAQGAIVRGGETILEIVPVQDRMEIEVRIKPQDVDNVTLEQSAKVRLTGFKQRTTPLLEGTVSYVSADTVQDQASRETFYEARIDVSNDQIALLGDRKLQPGMPAEVLIETGSRTAIQYLAQPMVESLNRAWREN